MVPVKLRAMMAAAMMAIAAMGATSAKLNAEEPATGAKAADAASGETRTPQEWYDYYLPRYRAVTAAWREILKDPVKHAKWANKDGDQIVYLERSQLYLLNVMSQYTYLPTKGDPIIGDYRQWQKAQGDTLLYKWLKGEPLTAAEGPYLPLLRGACWLTLWEHTRGGYMMSDGMHAEKKGIPDELMGVPDVAGLRRMMDAYCKRIAKESDALMFKGYRGEKLTEKDLDTLRVYGMIREGFVDPHCFDGYGYSITAHRADGGRPNMEFDLAFPPDRGSAMPHLRLLPLESVLKRLEYADGYFNDPLLAYKPEAIMMFLDRFIAYTACTVPAKKDQKPLKAITFAPLPPQSADLPDHVRLYSLKKPVLFLPYTVNDIDGPRVLESMNHLYEAYKDRVQFMLIGLKYNGCLPQFYGQPGDDQSRPGTRGVLGLHPLMDTCCIEERAGWLKTLLMSLPSVKVPAYLTDPCQEGASWGNLTFGMSYAQRENCYCLVSTDGRVVINDYGTSMAHYGYEEMCELVSSQVEVAIRKVLKNNGAWVDVKPFYGKKKIEGIFDHPEGALEGRAKGQAAIAIKTVDTPTRTIAGTLLWEVTGSVWEGRTTVNKPVTMQFDKNVLVRQYAVDIPFENLKPGDIVYLIRPGAADSKWDLTRLIRLQRITLEADRFMYCTTINTRVTSVDAAKAEIRADLNMNFNEMRGYQWWKKDKAITSYATSTIGSPKERMMVLDRIAAMDPHLVLKVKSPNRIMVNGAPGELGDIKPGDILSFPEWGGEIRDNTIEIDVLMASDPSVSR